MNIDKLQKLLRRIKRARIARQIGVFVWTHKKESGVMVRSLGCLLQKGKKELLKWQK